MSLVSLNAIKNWFKTGLKPTQAQFWDTWDSFRHKSEKVPVGDIDGLDELLSGLGSGGGSLKLDKGTYTGDAGLLDNRIDVLESLQDLSTSFIGKAYFIWTGVGLNFNLIYPNYYVEGVLHTGATEPMTLEPADPANPRLDVIAVNATGGIKKTGVPSVNPAAESLDSTTEIYVTTVLIAAGATTPTGMESVAIYKENAEWSHTSELPVTNFDATADPADGVNHIDVGAFTEAGVISFQDVVSHPIPLDGVIGFDANLKAAFSNSTKFLLVFFNDDAFASDIVTVKNGSYGFDRTVINQYQPILVPLSDFTFSLSEFDRFAIVVIGANTSGFKLDNIILSTGVGTTSPLQKALTSIVTDSGVANATTANDSFTFKGLGGLLVSAVGKVITFAVDFYTKTDIDDALALKLDAADYNQHFKGKYTSSANLIAAHPTASDGNYAVVDAGVGSDAKEWIWDNESGWIVSGSTGAATTDALAEGSVNLYWTVARFLANLTAANIKAALGITTLSGDNTGDSATPAETATTIGALIGGAADATPNDSDFIATSLTAGGILEKITWTNAKAFLKTYFDGYYATKTITVVSISSNTTLADSHCGKVLMLTASCTLTLPNGLMSGFNCSVATKAGVTLTYSLGGSVTLINNVGTTMAEKLTHTMVNTGVANEYLTAGNL